MTVAAAELSSETLMITVHASRARIIYQQAQGCEMPNGNKANIRLEPALNAGLL